VASPEVDLRVDLVIDGEPRRAAAPGPRGSVVAGERVREGEEGRGLGLGSGGGGGQRGDALVGVAPARDLVERDGRLHPADGRRHGRRCRSRRGGGGRRRRRRAALHGGGRIRTARPWGLVREGDAFAREAGGGGGDDWCWRSFGGGSNRRGDAGERMEIIRIIKGLIKCPGNCCCL
jgi:hypothetical protein